MLPTVLENSIEDTHRCGLDKFHRTICVTECGDQGFRPDVDEVVLMSQTEYLLIDTKMFWAHLGLHERRCLTEFSVLGTALNVRANVKACREQDSVGTGIYPGRHEDPANPTFSAHVKRLGEVARNNNSSLLLLIPSKDGHLIGSRLGEFQFGCTEMAPVSRIVVVLGSGADIPQFMKEEIAKLEESKDFKEHHHSRRVRIQDMANGTHRLEPHLQLASILLVHDSGNLLNTIGGTRDPVAPQASMCKRMLPLCRVNPTERVVADLNKFLFKFSAAAYVMYSGETFETNWCFEL